jgi:DNA-binding SARP family transcriptional activator
MGVHSGPVYRVEDINANMNVSGGGINIAQRVMDCGDAGHIFLSRSVAEILSQLSTWATHLHDIGEYEVKHGVRLHLFSLYGEGFGNEAPPAKLPLSSRDRPKSSVREATHSVVVSPRPGIAPSPSTRMSRPRLPAAALRIQFLGAFKVLRGNKAVTDAEWKNRKAHKLFKFLVLNRKRAVSREVLLDTFWSDIPDNKRASHNFSVIVSALRKALEPDVKNPSLSRYIVSESELWQFNNDATYWLDVAEFDERYRHSKRLEVQGDSQSAVQERFNAVALYKGELLPGDLYDDWCVPDRRQYQEMYVTLLTELASHFFRAEDHEQATDFCHRILAVDRCDERAHRMLMRCYSKMGRRTDAIRQFRACVDTLRKDLDLEPSVATLDLHRTIVGTGTQ